MHHKNIHLADRLLRVILAELLCLAGYFLLDGTLQIIFYFCAFLILLTAIIGISYIYTIFEWNTIHHFKDRPSKLFEGMLIYMIILIPALLFIQKEGFTGIQEQLLIGILVGFIAQIIDGSLGMAYGITSNSILLSFGIPPVASSASIHTAEIFTAGAEGLAHLKAGNVDKHVLKYLILPGMIGAVVGAYILVNIPGHYISPFVAVYLLIMGVLLVEKAFEKKPLIIRGLIFFRDKLMKAREERWGHKLMPFGLVGGILDSIGGGGWGPLITLTLFFKGENLRKAIGSVILSEFFVTVTASAALLTALKLEYWQTIVGLIVGGLLAVPLGPFLTKKLPYKPLMIMVGGLVVILSIRTISVFVLNMI